MQLQGNVIIAVPSGAHIHISSVLVTGRKLNFCLPGSFMTGGKSCSTLFFTAPFSLSLSACVWCERTRECVLVHFYRKTDRNYFIWAGYCWLLHALLVEQKEETTNTHTLTLGTSGNSILLFFLLFLGYPFSGFISFPFYFIPLRWRGAWWRYSVLNTCRNPFRSIEKYLIQCNEVCSYFWRKTDFIIF